jgi:predicted short-subunit dehydrogenase-like oxidoreductase (DUF2520 family)
MTFTIIGTGNMAWFLAKRLTAAGHQCVGVYGRNPQEAELLASSITVNPFKSLNDITDGQADMCFLTLSDYSIQSIAMRLFLESTVVVHTAGSVDMKVLAPASKDHAVLWPVYSIQKHNISMSREIPCAWEASSPKAKRFILSIAHGITDVLFEASGEQRRWLHMTAVISNNFINHLMAICEQICAAQNLPFSTLHPIIEQTFENIKHQSPYNAQTGPAKRGDKPTVDKHIAQLQSHPEWQQVYKVLSASIEHMYKVDNTDKAV